jgi:hypothetical protein
VLAAVGGAGWFTTVPEAAAAWVEAKVTASPGVDAAIYRDRHVAYRELYPALAPTFHAGA